MKRPALQNNWVGFLRTAFRARKDFGTFEKRAPDYCEIDFIGTRQWNCEGLGYVSLALLHKASRDKRKYFLVSSVM